MVSILFSLGIHLSLNEDRLIGPTHQPIALAAFYRALPNINLIRPADAEECMGMWLLALSKQSANTPSIFALSRQPVPLLSGTDRAKVAQGAYVVYGDDKNPDITIIATGAEVARAIESAKLLKSVKKVRVVSMPSQKHFDNQTAEYKESVLKSSVALVIAIEAWASYGWARYAHASLSMHTFVRLFPLSDLILSSHCDRVTLHPNSSCTSISDSPRKPWQRRLMNGRLNGKLKEADQDLVISKSCCWATRSTESEIVS